MPRNKVNIAHIDRENARKDSFNKRKKSLFNKLDELNRLCGVEGCAIMYSEYKSEPEVWPHDPTRFQNALNQFMEKSEIEKGKKMETQESYLHKRIDKVSDQISKHTAKNHVIQVDTIWSECMSHKASVTDLNATNVGDLMKLLDDKASAIDEMLEIVKSGPPPHSQLPQRQKFVGESSGTANQMVTEGMDVADCYVPVMENAGGSNERQTTGSNPEWLVNLVKHDMDFGGTMPHFDDLNPFTPGASFP